MSAALRSLMFLARRAELESAPTSGIRTVDEATLESPVTSPAAASVAPPAGPVKPGLYVVRVSTGSAIWVHVTPD